MICNVACGAEGNFRYAGQPIILNPSRVENQIHRNSDLGNVAIREPGIGYEQDGETGPLGTNLGVIRVSVSTC